MSKKSSGVSYYTTGQATIAVPFPEDQTVCAQCPYVTRRYGLRYECLLTMEHLLYPDTCRGNTCPVTFEKED
jgi:hypothetical protein